MKLVKNQAKTLNSQFSGIDIHTKLENSFLEKFFRHTIIDHFQDYFYNLLEHQVKTKMNDRHAKNLAHNLFVCRRTHTIEQLVQKIRKYYANKAKSFSSGQLNTIFQLKHFNLSPDQKIIKQGQLVMVEVKIKIDIENIQALPLKLIQQFQNYKVKLAAPEDNQLHNILANYKQEYFNFIIIYYGDTNFQLINKKHFNQQEIQIKGRKYKLRIFTFFVSKMAMLQTFKSNNKVPNIDYINDLVIQFYELKRQKTKRKKLMKSSQISQRDKEEKQLKQKKMVIQMSHIFLMGGVALGVMFLVKRMLI